MPVVKATNAQVLGPNVVLVSVDITALQGSKFVLEVDDTLAETVQLPVQLNDGGSANIPLFTRHSGYVRNNYLLEVIRLRKCGKLPCDGCNPNQFCVAYGIDPPRLNVLGIPVEICLFDRSCPRGCWTAPLAPVVTPPAPETISLDPATTNTTKAAKGS